MPKYMVRYNWSDGEIEDDDNYGEFWSSEEEAQAAGLEGLSNRKVGAEILYMSNPGDNYYDKSDFENDDFEVIEVD